MGQYLSGGGDDRPALSLLGVAVVLAVQALQRLQHGVDVPLAEAVRCLKAVLPLGIIGVVEQHAVGAAGVPSGPAGLL